MGNAREKITKHILLLLPDRVGTSATCFPSVASTCSVSKHSKRVSSKHLNVAFTRKPQFISRTWRYCVATRGNSSAELGVFPKRDGFHGVFCLIQGSGHKMSFTEIFFSILTERKCIILSRKHTHVCIS